MFLCCTSQGVDIVVKWLISLVVTSNHKCLNKIVTNKLALIIFESGTQPQRWYICMELKLFFVLLFNLFKLCNSSPKWWRTLVFVNTMSTLSFETWPHLDGDFYCTLHLNIYQSLNQLNYKCKLWHLLWGILTKT